MRKLIPTLLLHADRLYNRHTNFPRGRGACARIFRWGAKNAGFRSPILRLKSGFQFEYSPLVVNDVVIRGLLIKDSFESSQGELMRRHVPQGGTFIDIGANIGYFSILAST